MRVKISVAGHPAPKGSKTPTGRGYAMRESSKRCKPWVEQIAYAARANRPAGRTMEPPYTIDLVFFMPEPARPKYPWPSRDGDIDKLERAVLDGLTQGGLLVDDRHVIDLRSRKRFGTPRVEIAVATPS